jgi:hypothetical protein
MDQKELIAKFALAGELVEVSLVQVSWEDDENLPTYTYLQIGSQEGDLKLWSAFGRYIVSSRPPYEGAVPVDEGRYTIHES